MPRGEKLHKSLCEHFKLYPEIIFSDKISVHHYDEANRIIYFDLLDDRGWKWAIVHEFAHCLDRARCRSNGSRRHHHDVKFYRQLLKVIEFVYGDYKKYPWKYEYKTIQRLAKKDGYM